MLLQKLLPTNINSDMAYLFMGLVGTILVGIILGIATDAYFLFGLPVLYLGAYLAIVDFRKIFYLLLATIPLSTEVNLPGGFGTDFPSELLVIVLMGIYSLYLIRNGTRLDSHFFKHPITLLLLLHLAWIGISSLHAGEKIISLKFLLAKIWYVTTYYFLAGLLLKTEKDLKNFFKWVFIPLLFTVIIVMIRHALDGFSFEGINLVLNPFYRNHVNYAAILVVFFPFLWYAPNWAKKYSWKWFRLRLMKVVIGAVLIAGIIGVNFVSTNNKYLDFAPDYNKTIAHKKFDNLIDATAKGEDVSTMERVYRWVAGFYMVAEKPLTGFGPGNFYSYYSQYTVNSFRTYVSDNPEKSGIHSYYLMTAVEQGIIGLVIFLALCFTVLLKAEQLYHRTKKVATRRMILMVTLSIVIIDALCLINDMVETDKVGAFFFMGMAVLVNLEREIELQTVSTDS